MALFESHLRRALRSCLVVRHKNHRPAVGGSLRHEEFVQRHVCGHRWTLEMAEDDDAQQVAQERVVFAPVAAVRPAAVELVCNGIDLHIHTAAAFI